MRHDTARKAAPHRTRRLDESGYVSEIFCSIQGEGLYVGERHLFLRMAGCSATCSWCDTVAAKEEQDHCVVHTEPRRSMRNPLGSDTVLEEVLEMAGAARPAAVSVTGGEPLEQAGFVAAVVKRLKRKGIRVYLETNGLEVDGLSRVRPYVDVVAMDIKLPHATGRPHWDTHREFLKWLVGRNSFVKIVVDSTTPFEEIETAVHLIAEVDRKFPLVLQPESSTYLKRARGIEAARALAVLLDRGQRLALESLQDVRVIPQCHKIMRVR